MRTIPEGSAHFRRHGRGGGSRGPGRQGTTRGRGSRLRLEVKDLACRRGERRVFEGVSFALREGGALLVRGRNGAGKSSLLALLTGQLAPAAGTIRITGAG